MWHAQMTGAGGLRGKHVTVHLRQPDQNLEDVVTGNVVDVGNAGILLTYDGAEIDGALGFIPWWNVCGVWS